MPDTITIWSHYERPLPADRDILADRGARNSYSKLMEEGKLNGEELLDRLRALVLLASLPIFKEGDWAEGSGKTRRTLRYFPARLRNVADEITRIGKHPFLGSRGLAHSYPGDPDYDGIAVCFQVLPDILRLYSKHLGHFCQTAQQMSRGRSFSQKLIVHLSDWLYQATGRYFDTELSWLIAAAFEADGQDKVVSADALKVLHSPGRRYISLPRPTEIELIRSERIVRMTVEC